jgi:hypothetical protein
MGDSAALTSVVVIAPGFLPVTRAPSPTLSLESIVTFPPLPSAPGMKFAFEIKTEPVMQAAIIIAVVAFSSGSLATVTIYTNNSTVSTFYAVALAVIIYLALRFLPC